jgi:hypothetical protein
MKKDPAMEYGTSLHLVNARNNMVTEDFWGDEHSTKALAHLKKLQEAGPVLYHQFVPLEKAVK